MTQQPATPTVHWTTAPDGSQMSFVWNGKKWEHLSTIPPQPQQQVATQPTQHIATQQTHQPQVGTQNQGYNPTWDVPQPQRPPATVFNPTNQNVTVDNARKTSGWRRIGAFGCLIPLLIGTIVILLFIALLPQIEKWKWGMDIANAPAASCSSPYAEGWNGAGDGDAYANSQVAPEGTLWVYLEKNPDSSNKGRGKVVKTLPGHGAKIHRWLLLEECAAWESQFIKVD